MIDQSPITANELLARLRSLAAQAELQPARPADAPEGADFSAMLKRSLDQVNQAQQAAAKAGNAFEVGDPNTTVADVMLAAQKASLSFQAATQVRNKLVDAYQEIMRMSV
jgi:flagellar hook-basal body complex protein FliE